MSSQVRRDRPRSNPHQTWVPRGAATVNEPSLPPANTDRSSETLDAAAAAASRPLRQRNGSGRPSYNQHQRSNFAGWLRRRRILC
ncbi:BnaA08g25940D [Brassica napus]|uniref:BnaA08g25940D protein n=1 Tax=Brassica napus TaxID=3708 RepID=A0A078H0Y5_BRANA|nr:BnaC08g14040D [Brassica napus]CDY31044.1 BnaA08g25940D [Brassica napus]